MIIRYLDKEKFEWLLQDQGVYIGAASDQSDKCEGIYDSASIFKVLNHHSPKFEKIICEKFDELVFNQMQMNRNDYHLSSWYEGENEIQEMWDEYGKDGVALVSEVNALIQGLPEPLGNAASFYKIIYGDIEKSRETNHPFKHKEEKFRHENEFRLVLDMRKYSLLTGFDKEKFGITYVGDAPSYETSEIICCISPKGIKQSDQIIRKKGAGYVIAFDLSNLIREIRLHPNCTEENELWINSRLKAAGLHLMARRSALNFVFTQPTTAL